MEHENYKVGQDEKPNPNAQNPRVLEYARKKVNTKAVDRCVLIWTIVPSICCGVLAIPVFFVDMLLDRLSFIAGLLPLTGLLISTINIKTFISRKMPLQWLLLSYVINVPVLIAWILITSRLGWKNANFP